MTLGEARSVAEAGLEQGPLPDGMFIQDAARLARQIDTDGSCLVTNVATSAQGAALATDLSHVALSYQWYSTKVLDVSAGEVTEQAFEETRSFEISAEKSGILVINGLNKVVRPKSELSRMQQRFVRSIIRIIDNKNGPAVCAINIDDASATEPTRGLVDQNSFWGKFRSDYQFAGNLHPSTAYEYARRFIEDPTPVVWDLHVQNALTFSNLCQKVAELKADESNVANQVVPA